MTGRGDTAGVFITFEGPEGAGKTTQIAHLTRHLTAAGTGHVLTREPGGTPFGTRVREVVLDPELQIDPLPEFLLYSASRAQLVQDVIRPALAAGQVVICDRYADSSLAYQGAGRGLDDTFLRDVTRAATGDLTPNLTVLLDVDPRVGLARAAARGQPDRLERADLAFHDRVRSGFLTLARLEPARFLTLDGTRDPDDLALSVWTAVQARLNA